MIVPLTCIIIRQCLQEVSGPLRVLTSSFGRPAATSYIKRSPHKPYMPTKLWEPPIPAKVKPDDTEMSKPNPGKAPAADSDSDDEEKASSPGPGFLWLPYSAWKRLFFIDIDPLVKYGYKTRLEPPEMYKEETVSNGPAVAVWVLGLAAGGEWGDVRACVG